MSKTVKAPAKTEVESKVQAQPLENQLFYRIKKGVSVAFVNNTVHSASDNPRFAENQEVIRLVKDGYLELDV